LHKLRLLFLIEMPIINVVNFDVVAVVVVVVVVGVCLLMLLLLLWGLLFQSKVILRIP